MTGRPNVYSEIRLTPREREILNYAMQGYSAPKTAELLAVNIETVKSHRSNIIQKYQAQNMIHAVTLHLTQTAASAVMPEIILQTRLRSLLRVLMQKLENELNTELAALLKKVMKDLHY